MKTCLFVNSQVVEFLLHFKNYLSISTSLFDWYFGIPTFIFSDPHTYGTSLGFLSLFSASWSAMYTVYNARDRYPPWSMPALTGNGFGLVLLILTYHTWSFAFTKTKNMTPIGSVDCCFRILIPSWVRQVALLWLAPVSLLSGSRTVEGGLVCSHSSTIHIVSLLNCEPGYM